MSRFVIFIYGMVTYLVGMAGLACFVLALANWPLLFIPFDAQPVGNVGIALVINGGLMLLFGLQHSVMARPAFKEKWTALIPKAAERSTYVGLSGVFLILLSRCWQPLPGTLWRLEAGPLSQGLTIGLLLGWGLVGLSSFVINHFELFGLQQVYLNLVGQPMPTPQFQERFLYKVVRHPLQLGVLIGLWVTPTMTTAHLMLAATMTVYILIGLYYEEKDLVTTLGEVYADYQRRVPKLLPIPFSRQT